MWRHALIHRQRGNIQNLLAVNLFSRVSTKDDSNQPLIESSLMLGISQKKTNIARDIGGSVLKTYLLRSQTLPANFEKGNGRKFLRRGLIGIWESHASA